MNKEAMKLEPCGGCYGSGWITRDPDIGTDQECFVCGGSGVCPKEPAQQEQEWIETACALIKAADDAAADADYMLDSDDCIKVVRGEWKGHLMNDRPAAPQPAQQEPVAWLELLREARDNCKASIVEEGISASRKEYRIDLEARLTAALNSSPPAQRTWVGLTDEEIEQGCKESWVTEQAWQSAVWWAEAKLKEKNT